MHDRETNYMWAWQQLAGWHFWEPHHVTPMGPGTGCPLASFGAGVTSSLNIKRMILNSAAGRDSRTVAGILKLSHLVGSHLVALIWSECQWWRSTPSASLHSRTRQLLLPRSASFSFLFLSPAAGVEDKLCLCPSEKRDWAEDRAITDRTTSRSASWARVWLYINNFPASHVFASKKKKYNRAKLPQS